MLNYIKGAYFMEEVIENESEKTLDQKKVELERKQFEKMSMSHMKKEVEQ